MVQAVVHPAPDHGNFETMATGHKRGFHTFPRPRSFLFVLKNLVALNLTQLSDISHTHPPTFFEKVQGYKNVYISRPCF
jgi:hypothetical protein